MHLSDRCVCALKDVEGTFDVHKSQARIYVDCEGEYDYDGDSGAFKESVRHLVGICPVVRMEDQGFDQIERRCRCIYG